MSKTFLSFLVFICLLTACGTVPEFDSDAVKIANAAAEIAQFEIPAGLNPEFTFSLYGYRMVSFSSGENGSHLYFIQSQNEMDAEIVKQQVDNYISTTTDINNHTTVIESRPVVIRGNETTLVLSEGRNGDGRLYKQAMLSFESLGGPALLIFSTPSAIWNQETLNSLVESIH